jgi:ankyrin repeat protein
MKGADMPKVIIPEEFLCPITRELMVDPVATSDGQIYERSAIEKWLKEHVTSPLTNLRLEHRQLISIPLIKRQIQAFIEQAKLHTQEAFFQIIKNGNLEVVERLNFLDSYLIAKDSENITALHWATFLGHDTVVRWMLSVGASTEVKAKENVTRVFQLPTTEEESELQSVLISIQKIEHNEESVWFYKPEKITRKILISNKIDCGMTPLHCAALKGHDSIVEQLLAFGAKIEAKDIDGKTPLVWATLKGHSQIVQRLIVVGAQINVQDNSCMNFDKRPLHWAALMGHHLIVQLLFAAGAQTEVRDCYKFTPMHWAVLMGHVTIVQQLLTYKAKIEVKDVFSRRPLHLAALMGHGEIIHLLLAAGAQTEVKDETYSDRHRTPLHYAVQRGHTTIVQQLLSGGAQIESRDDEDETPLHWAAYHDQDNIVQLLLAKNANPEARNSRGSTPLHRAAANGKNRFVELLLVGKANINASNNDGDTPLHRAAHNGRADTVKLLLTKGANYKAVNNAGQTPAQLAATKDYQEIAALISSYHQKLKSETRQAPARIGELEKIVAKQQQEIEQLKGQLNEVLSRLNMKDVPKKSQSYSPHLFKK